MPSCCHFQTGGGAFCTYATLGLLDAVRRRKHTPVSYQPRRKDSGGGEDFAQRYMRYIPGVLKGFTRQTLIKVEDTGKIRQQGWRERHPDRHPL